MTRSIKTTFTATTIFMLLSSWGLSAVAGRDNDYLGQTPPTDEPILFAPGIVSTSMNDRDFAVSPDLSEIYYSVLEAPFATLVCIEKKDGKWQTQKIASFSGRYNDCEPFFAPDGQRLYFCSDRPLTGEGPPKDYDIWYVERTGKGWSTPRNPGPPVNTDRNEFYPAVTASGTMYITSHDMNIMRCEFSEGEYQEPVALGDSVNSRMGDYNAYVAPDESYLIFTTHGRGHRAGQGDLVISFRKPDGSWSEARTLGAGVNSGSPEMCPFVSPDGKYLFFSSRRSDEEYDPSARVTTYMQLLDRASGPRNKKFDIYWVRADVIQQVRPEWD